MTFHFTTPKVPQEIKELRCDGYRNIFEYDATIKNLFGTETLFGDWSGDLLVVAKDWGPYSVIEKLIQKEDLQPYRYEPSLPTNKRLVEILLEHKERVCIDGSSNISCGVLYVSACFFLRAGRKRSGPLLNKQEWMDKSNVVFGFVLGNMPKLTKIACLGEDSFSFVTRYFNITKCWRTCLEERKPIVVGGCSIYAQSHTGHFGTLNRKKGASFAENKKIVQDDWDAMMQPS